MLKLLIKTNDKTLVLGLNSQDTARDYEKDNWSRKALGIHKNKNNKNDKSNIILGKCAQRTMHVMKLKQY